MESFRGVEQGVVGLLEIMLDPFARATATYAGEPVSVEEGREIAVAKAALARREAIRHDEILADFGPSPVDFDRIGRTPLEPCGANQ